MSQISVCQVKITERQIKWLKECSKKPQGQGMGCVAFILHSKTSCRPLSSLPSQPPTRMAVCDNCCSLSSPHSKAPKRLPTRCTCVPLPLLYLRFFSHQQLSVLSHVHPSRLAFPGLSLIHYLHPLYKGLGANYTIPTPYGLGEARQDIRMFIMFTSYI